MTLLALHTDRFAFRTAGVGQHTECILRIFADVPGLDGLLALATERHDNPGLSITNASEFLWAEVQQLLPGAPLVFAEHYCDQISYGKPRCDHNDRGSKPGALWLDGDAIDWVDHRTRHGGRHPWMPCTMAEFAQRVGTPDWRDLQVADPVTRNLAPSDYLAVAPEWTRRRRA